jgi:transposase
MPQSRKETDREVLWIDLAGKSSAICIVEKEGEDFCEFELTTDEKNFNKVFGELSPALCLLEASPLAEWAAGVIEGCGHEVVIIDPRKAKAVVRTWILHKNPVSGMSAVRPLRRGQALPPGVTGVRIFLR